MSLTARKGILAGVLIGLGGFAFLSVSGGLLGAVLFSIGLLSVLVFQANLYTGWVCKPEKYNLSLITVFITNALGAILIGLLSSEALRKSALTVVNSKLENSLAHWLIASIFCGLFIGIAVRSWSHKASEIIVMLCVVGFILTGSEHVIADIYYFATAGLYNIIVYERIFIAALGNTIGGLIIIWLLKED